jgi:YlmC/YmxH family sporulation protein
LEAAGMELAMCCIEDLARKDVINVKDGCRLGFVGDVEIDTCDGKIVSLIIYGRTKFFGLFGREDDLVIPWCDIQKIGEDIILVCCEPTCRPLPKRRGGFFELFH